MRVSQKVLPAYCCQQSSTCAPICDPVLFRVAESKGTTSDKTSDADATKPNKVEKDMKVIHSIRMTCGWLVHLHSLVHPSIRTQTYIHTDTHTHKLQLDGNATKSAADVELVTQQFMGQV